MTWSVVARKDFSDAIRSKVLWLLSALFVLLTAGLAYLYTILLNMSDAGGGGPGIGELTVDGLIFFMLGSVGLLIPLTGLVVGYKALAGEVESGTSKILLSLPHTRRDAVLGKVVGRTAVLAVPIAVGFVAAAVVVLVWYESFAVVDYLLFALLTVLFGAVYVSLAVAVSSTTKSTGVATAGIFGVFILFQVLWDLIPMGINYLVNGTFFVTGTPPDWYQFVTSVQPGAAYNSVAQSAFLDSDPAAQVGQAASTAFSSPEFGVAVLVFWLVVPVTLGYLRFRSMDL